VLHSVVQIVALRRGMMGNYTSAWTGSGTVVDPSGIILTNCHVANPRAMGMPLPAADQLAVATTDSWIVSNPWCWLI
jgi:S1-C subfamily serine protease